MDFINREKERKDKLPGQTVQRLSGHKKDPVETYNCLNLSGFLAYFLQNPQKSFRFFEGAKVKIILI